jgi:hypothetical protein
MPDVFISYSRKDLAFIEMLVEGLKEQGKNPWFDQIKEPLQGIPPGSNWWDEIAYGIETVDNFLFVISPGSIASPYCHAEIAHAMKHNKRIVTLLYCDTGREIDILQAVDEGIEAIPEDRVLPQSIMGEMLNLRELARRHWLALSQIQYVVFSEQLSLEMSQGLLIQALDLDLAWVKLRSQIRQAAQLWADNGYSKGYLWSQERLMPVYEMLERVRPELNELEREFLKPEAEHLLDELKDVETTHIRREAIGQRLNEIGDTRRGVGLRSDGLPDIDWCYVEGGIVKVGTKSFTLQPFYIARYLITLRQFQVFVDDPDGFQEKRRWGTELSYGKLFPPRQKYDNYPRDSLSWYQAVGFTRWLTANLPSDGFPEALRQDWTIRLPTEWEWQWAAQGGQQAYVYPWGESNSRYANTTDAGIGRSTAVGLYPFGAAVCGALDLAGNLAEWCQNPYSNENYVELATTSRRMVRGGAFSDPPSQSRCTAQANDYPNNANVNRGFRIVYAPDVNLGDEASEPGNYANDSNDWLRYT